MSAPEKYSIMDGIAGVGFLVNAMEGGGDYMKAFPRSDAEDMSRGARFIPGEVTLARRAGAKVQFVAECGPNCWYWSLPSGERIYHYAGDGLEGKPCPDCGNPNTRGGKVSGV